jgi:hypothetical protein
LFHDTTPVKRYLKELRPLRIEVIRRSGSLLKEFKSLLVQYHYPDFDRTIGENMKYMGYTSRVYCIIKMDKISKDSCNKK